MTAFLHGLRMMGDLLIYSAFAAFFAACLGGTLAAQILLLPALCYGVSACFLNRPILRTGCAAVSLLGLLLVPDWVDRAAYLPAVFYPLYLAWKGEYLLSADRQADIFLLFCKAYPVFAILLSLAWNGKVMLAVSLPLAVWAVLLQIFLMRVLRQAPALYRNPGYLLANAGLLMLLGVFGFLVSCPTVLGAAQTAGGVGLFWLGSSGSDGPAFADSVGGRTFAPACHHSAFVLDCSQKRKSGPGCAGKRPGADTRRRRFYPGRRAAVQRRTGAEGCGGRPAGDRLYPAVPPSAPKEQSSPGRGRPGQNPEVLPQDAPAVAVLFPQPQRPGPAGLWQIFGAAGPARCNLGNLRDQSGPFGPDALSGPGGRTAAAPSLSESPVWGVRHAPGRGGSGAAGKGPGTAGTERTMRRTKAGCSAGNRCMQNLSDRLPIPNPRPVCYTGLRKKAGAVRRENGKDETDEHSCKSCAPGLWPDAPAQDRGGNRCGPDQPDGGCLPGGGIYLF